MNRKISDRRMARLMELKRRANRAIRAEEEAEIEDAEVVDESAEEQEVSEQETPEQESEEQESEEQEVSEKITLDDGSEIDGNVDLSELDGSELVRIVRADGIVLYMQAQNEEEAKEIYEAICDATMKEDYESKEQEESEEESEEEPEEELSEAEEISEEVLSDIPEDADAVAVEVKEASMKAPSRLYYVIRSRRGTRAYRATRILPRIMAGRVARKVMRPMAALRMAIKASKRKMSLRPSRRVARRMTRRMPMRMASRPVRSPMARQTRLEKARRMAMRRKMAERLPNRAERRAASRAAGRISRRPMTHRHAATAEIEDALKVRETKTPPNKWDLDFSDEKKNDYDSDIAFEKKDFDKADDSGKVKAAPSDVRSYYGKLPSKAATGEDVEFGLKDFNQKRKNASVLKAVAQNLKTARTQLKAKDEELAKKDSEIKSLKARLQKIADKENLKKRSALIDGLIAAMHCEDEEEIAAMRSKFASYSDEQLNAVHETLTKSAAETVTEHEEDVLMSNIRKEAGELSGFTPSMTLKDEPMNSFDAIEKEILEKEQNSLN